MVCFFVFKFHCNFSAKERVRIDNPRYQSGQCIHRKRYVAGSSRENTILVESSTDFESGLFSAKSMSLLFEATLLSDIIRMLSSYVDQPPEDENRRSPSVRLIQA